MGRSLKLIAILAFASLAVTACGKRGALEAPAASAEETGAKDVGSGKAKKEEHRPFILDGLLR